MLNFFLAIMFAFGIIGIKIWPTQMPVWALVLALIICEHHFSFRTRNPANARCSLCILHSYRDDSGHHKSASWSQCSHRVDHRIRAPWTPNCNDDVQGEYHIVIQ